MSRLIDADVLLDICKNKYSDIVAGSYPFNVVVYDLVNIIESQPLAYDVEKVVKELEKQDDDCGCGKISVWDAIDIVKRGGIE